MTSISTLSPSDCIGNCAPVGTDSNGVTLVPSVVAAALLFPVLIFIGSATPLSAARREQRFAAMRLIGATPRQITRLATVESGVATVAGVIVGFSLYAAMRPVLAKIPFTGERFFTSDVSLSVANVLLVAIGIPIAAAVAAWLGLRRVKISPLGVTRRVTPRPPRAWRLIPMFAGIGWLSYLAFSGTIRSMTSIDQAYAYLSGVFSTMIGLVVAGPWLTMIGSRLVAARSRHPDGLIAARRLNDNPKAAFRAVSGLVLAVFVSTCAIGIITTIVAYNGDDATGGAESTATLIDLLDGGRVAPGSVNPAAAQNELASIPGVEGVAAVRAMTVDSNQP